MSNTITHSGFTFKSLGLSENSRRMWEPKEFTIRFNFTEEQAAKIIELNPGGIEEGGLYKNVKGLPDDFLNEKGCYTGKYELIEADFEKLEN